MVIFETRIDIAVPVELIHQVVEIVGPVLGNILDQQFPRDGTPFNHRLIHAKYIRAPLRLVSDQRTRGVQDARRHQPARAGLEPVCLAEVEDAIVPFVPAFQATADVGLGRSRLQAKKGVGKVVAHRV